MNTYETPEQAIRRISNGLWVRVPSDGPHPFMTAEHALRRPDALSTRCSLSLRHVEPVQADGSRPPCRGCLRSIQADQAMQIPIPGPDGTLTRAIASAEELREAARALAGMLVDAKVHPDTIAAVLGTVVAPETVEQVMAPWR